MRHDNPRRPWREVIDMRVSELSCYELSQLVIAMAAAHVGRRQSREFTQAWVRTASVTFSLALAAGHEEPIAEPDWWHHLEPTGPED